MLLHKLNSYGIGGKLNEWIIVFLTGRSQRVILGEAVPDWCSVTSGVPQGSVLGPTLFIIYINDMPDSISSPVKLFAYDLKILAHIDLRNPKDSVKVYQRQY